MRTVIIGCQTLEDELHAAIKKTGVEYPVEWVESGLHNVPQKLTARLQEKMDGIRADRVLLAMGYCGNSLAGLHTGAFETIIPRVDDCISLLLGSVERRVQISRENSAYYFTEGWLRGERNIWVEYQYTVDKYGQETADEIMGMMYSHYSSLALLDCGLHPIDSLEEQTRIIAEALHLKQIRVSGTLDYLCCLLTGPWPSERFLTVSANKTIAVSDLTLNSISSSLQ